MNRRSQTFSYIHMYLLIICLQNKNALLIPLTFSCIMNFVTLPDRVAVLFDSIIVALLLHFRFLFTNN